MLARKSRVPTSRTSSSATRGYARIGFAKNGDVPFSFTFEICILIFWSLYLYRV
ncbi:hypothetical protein F383_18017 [Gossypium arboreum]|uniref:Uncharacterized protein n=1 Tax=Gossypium arboreum TaxID=29729 RepID=A0A0B0NTF3_GOSAR|nr:hypothetical protein F383_18017 [Gossypium arboreum]